MVKGGKKSSEKDEGSHRSESSTPQSSAPSVGSDKQEPLSEESSQSADSRKTRSRERSSENIPDIGALTIADEAVSDPSKIFKKMEPKSTHFAKCPPQKKRNESKARSGDPPSSSFHPGSDMNYLAVPGDQERETASPRSPKEDSMSRRKEAVSPKLSPPPFSLLPRRACVDQTSHDPLCPRRRQTDDSPSTSIRSTRGDASSTKLSSSSDAKVSCACPDKNNHDFDCEELFVRNAARPNRGVRNDPEGEEPPVFCPEKDRFSGVGECASAERSFKGERPKLEMRYENVDSHTRRRCNSYPIRRPDILSVRWKKKEDEDGKDDKKPSSETAPRGRRNPMLRQDAIDIDAEGASLSHSDASVLPKNPQFRTRPKGSRLDAINIDAEGASPSHSDGSVRPKNPQFRTRPKGSRLDAINIDAEGASPSHSDGSVRPKNPQFRTRPKGSRLDAINIDAEGASPSHSDGSVRPKNTQFLTRGKGSRSYAVDMDAKGASPSHSDGSVRPKNPQFLGRSKGAHAEKTGKSSVEGYGELPGEYSQTAVSTTRSAPPNQFGTVDVSDHYGRKDAAVCKTDPCQNDNLQHPDSNRKSSKSPIQRTESRTLEPPAGTLSESVSPGQRTESRSSRALNTDADLIAGVGNVERQFLERTESAPPRRMPNCYCPFKPYEIHEMGCPKLIWLKERIEERSCKMSVEIKRKQKLVDWVKFSAEEDAKDKIKYERKSKSKSKGKKKKDGRKK